MTRTSRLSLALCMIVTVLSAGLWYKPASAKSNHGWSPDAKVPGYLDDTFTPFLLADHNRTIHAFTSQWIQNDGRRRAIVYRQWSLAGGWTRPVDILLAPTGNDANFVGAYLDSSDKIHVIFMSAEEITGKISVYYSKASASDADWAPAWSDPVLIAGNGSDLNSGAIIGDDEGNLVVIYSGNLYGSGVYYVYSKDGGGNWSDVQSLFLTYDPELSAFSLRLAIGPNQDISAAWNLVTNTGLDDSLYFANFDKTKFKWESPVELEERIDLPEYFGPSFPTIVNDGREIVIVYNSGNPFSDRPVGAGRPITRAHISLDGGLTWHEPTDPFPLHIGRSGEHTMALDGEGNPHLLFIQRIELQDNDGSYKTVGGIWHSVLQNGAWTNPDRLVATRPAHDVRATVVQGNVLLAVWREDPGSGEDGVWYSYITLDVPELPVTPLATSSFDNTISSDSSSTLLTITPNLLASQLTPQPGLLEDVPPSDLGGNPALPIIIGTVPVILILIIVFFGYRFLLNRRAR